MGAPRSWPPGCAACRDGGNRAPSDLLDRFDLAGAADRVTAGFSHGMGRRISVVLAAFHDPDVLLLDEPFDGVDPLGVETPRRGDRARPGCAAPPSSSPPTCSTWRSQACDEAVVLRRGAVVAAAPAAELARRGGRRALPSLLS